MSRLARHLFLSALAMTLLACKHAPATKPADGAPPAKISATKTTEPKQAESDKPKPSGDAPATGSMPKRGGPLTGLFKKSPAATPASKDAAPAKPADNPAGATEAKSTKDDAALAPAAKPKKKTLFAAWFQGKQAADDAGEKPAKPARKKSGFRWPWSKPEPVEAPAPEPAPKPTAETIPYGLPPTPLLEIKPREPETGLAPATTPPPAGKKANPIDDIGLYPEQ